MQENKFMASGTDVNNYTFILSTINVLDKENYSAEGFPDELWNM